MAYLDIAPDLNKAPPHVEGDLLRQGSQSIFGRKSWKKFFFIVLKDKLQYFAKRDDYRANKEPEAYIRMSQVMSITEVVFSGVPKKHHLNCGFSVEAFHPDSQQKVTLNLLAETPEDMRYWVFALRYIKAYYAKMKTRETVMNEEAERKILEKLLSGGDEPDDEESLVWGEYSLNNEEANGSTGDDSGSNVMVFFGDGSKVKVHMESTDTTSDLLDKEEVKRRLNSSAAYISLIDGLGNDMILKPDDRPALFPGKVQKLYALDHKQRVLPIFFSKKEFECIVVTVTTCAGKILDNHDISVQIDVQGLTNCGLFLKTDMEEEMFDSSECPCELLFEDDLSGAPVRQPVGKLMVRNKSLGGGRGMGRTKLSRRTPRTTVYKPHFRTNTEEQKILEEKYEEEQAQSKALDMLWTKKKGYRIPPIVPIIEGPSLSSDHTPGNLGVEVDIDGEQWIVAESKQGKRSPSPSQSSTDARPTSRDLEEAVVVHPQSNGMVSRNPTAPPSMESRKRSSAMSEMSPKVRNRTSAESGSGKRSVKEDGSPLMSPRDGSPVGRRSRSPGRKLPDIPDAGSSESQTGTASSHSPFRRRNATKSSGTITEGKSSSMKEHPSSSKTDHSTFREHSSSLSGRVTSSTPAAAPSLTIQEPPAVSLSTSLPLSTASYRALKGKGPTIRFSGKESPTPPLGALPSSQVVMPTSRWDNGPITKHSRSATIRSSGVENLSVNSSRSSNFGRSSAASTYVPEDDPHKSSSLTKGENITSGDADMPSANNTGEAVDESAGENFKDPVEALRPMVINFEALQVEAGQSPGEDKTEESRGDHVAAGKGKTPPIRVTSPNLLKIILLQSSEAHDSTSDQPMDFIMLSGIALSNHKGVWSIQEGYNFHDELPADCDDHTETFTLPGGIRTIYNHTHKRWHVLPPMSESQLSVNSSTDVGDSADGGQEGKYEKMAEMQYVSKKVLVTEVGSAFHHVVEMFAQTRDISSKKKIGSDMTNPAMGHLIRGPFCSSLVSLLLDGLRPYRFQGIVQDDIWKITTAFCNSAANDPSCSLVSPTIDKLIFQPINALKATMRDNNVKFRTFVSLAMSRNMLVGWLEALPKQTAVLHKHYLPSGFLCLVSGNHAYQQLYQQMLLTLEPMIHLPFDLSIDFESRHRVARSGPNEEPTSGKTSIVNPSAEDLTDDGVDAADAPLTPPSDQSPSQIRSEVVVKTHAATGQRTTAGNVLNAVWSTSPLPSPSHSPTLLSHSTHLSHHTQTNTSVSTSSINELDGTNEAEGSEEVSLKKRVAEVDSSRTRREPSPEQAVDVKQTFMKFGGSLLKKFSDGFQQINKGGAITGVPGMKQNSQSSSKEASLLPSSAPPVAPPVAPTGERMVEALYTNLSDDTDELRFNKGDRLVVKEQINQEWLICSLRGKTGIVPMNYITQVS